MNIAETSHGRLVGLTPRGWFHIQRLHLNRAQLIEMRHMHRVLESQKDELLQTREAENRLRQENGELKDEISRLRTAMLDLLLRGER